MKKMFSFLAFAVLLSASLLAGGKKLAEKEKVDLVIFSFNRPMQLFAFLESSEKYLLHLNKVHAIVRASDANYLRGYELVARRFPRVQMHYQHNAPHDFKPLVVSSVFSKKSRSQYVMFAVDDMIITDLVDLAVCTEALKKQQNAWFFSLRLGKNIVYCGMLKHDQPVPKVKKKGGNVFQWKFNKVPVNGDWNYPNTTDTTIYRKKDIKYFFKKLEYTNPNILEGAWCKRKPKRKKGLCFAHSSTINIPMNVVNPYFTSENMGIATQKLLDLFLDGYKIDIDRFYRVNNPSPHVNYEPAFIKR